MTNYDETTDSAEKSQSFREALAESDMTTPGSVKTFITNNTIEAFSEVPENYKAMVQRYTIQPVQQIITTSVDIVDKTIPDGENIDRVGSLNYNSGLADKWKQSTPTEPTTPINLDQRSSLNYNSGLADKWKQSTPTEPTTPAEPTVPATGGADASGAVLANSLHYGGYVVLAFFGALMCFGIYKLVKWLRNRKKEEALNVNLFKIKHKFKEGNDFIKSLSTRLTENEQQKITKMYTTIEKARPLTKELAAYALEASEKKDSEKSFLKRKTYHIVGFIAGIATILVWCVNKQ